MVKEAIVLAGGLGTRLRSEVKALPKSMAPIRDRPFLEYLFDYLIANGVEKLILSVGYKSAAIQDHFSNRYKHTDIEYVVEASPLGTGGAIKNAMQAVTGDYVIVTNGDSLITADIQKQYQAQLDLDADVSFALKPMKQFDRYGRITIGENHSITAFEEKQAVEEGLINAGLYIFKRQSFDRLQFPEKFSIEKEYFESHLQSQHFIGIQTSGYFLDIGIPKDFAKAQYEIGLFPNIDRSWTLFLDRDGVINKKIDGDYVRSIDQFEVLPGVIDALQIMSQHVGKIIVVTNQQGVGKGLMSTSQVEAIHEHFKDIVKSVGVHIDALYYAPQLAEENSIMRKPNIGMAMQAKADFPDIDFNKSIMIGDSISDMEFGKGAGMHGVYISQAELQTDDFYTVHSLFTFSEIIETIL